MPPVKDPILNAQIDQPAQILQRPRITLSQVPQPNGLSSECPPTTTHLHGRKTKGVPTLPGRRTEKTH